jgi:hypothetical protein
MRGARLRSPRAEEPRSYWHVPFLQELDAQSIAVSHGLPAVFAAQQLRVQ